MVGSAILLFSCDKTEKVAETENNEALMTEESENLTVLMSENGRRSYYFKTPLLEGYTLAKDPYREFRKGIDITTYQDDSLSTVNSTLVANYAIYYENRKLWEAKGNVEVVKSDSTKLYTQQLFWNSMTKRIYSNVDTKIVTASGDVWVGEGFESDEELKHWTFRRMKGKMRVDVSQADNGNAAPDTDSVEKNDTPNDGRGDSAAKPAREEKTDAPESVKPQRSQPEPDRERNTSASGVKRIEPVGSEPLRATGAKPVSIRQTSPQGDAKLRMRRPDEAEVQIRKNE